MDIRLSLENKALVILARRLPGALLLGFCGPRGSVFGTVELTPAEAREAARALRAEARLAERTLSQMVSEPGAHIRHAVEGELASYRVAVDYCTASGGGTRYVTVEARNWREATDRANAIVRKRRGVLKIDGGHSIGQPVTLA